MLGFVVSGANDADLDKGVVTAARKPAGATRTPRSVEVEIAHRRLGRAYGVL